MVHRGVAAVVVLLKHREIYDPQKLKPIRIDQTELVCEENSKSAHIIKHDFLFARAEKHDVADFKLAALDEFIQLAFFKEFYQRPL